ncbi:MAG: serine--tRNA ligase, partial [Candidatus Marinimicrobia bacterium]|nr:serine--tRNA ligase [Candidatus Neomarinimicrobiota bacterium]
MLDIKKIRLEPEKYRKGLEAKGGIKKNINLLLEIDARRRSSVAEVDQLKGLRNKVSDEIAAIRKAGKSAGLKIKEMRKVAEKIKSLDSKISDLEKKIKNIMITLPNISHESVKVGYSPEENEILRYWGKKPTFDFKI